MVLLAMTRGRSLRQTTQLMGRAALVALAGVAGERNESLLLNGVRVGSLGKETRRLMAL